MSPGPLELTIESLAAGGEGVARAPGGRVVFVPFSAPGDRILAEIVEEHARYARAKVKQLLCAGPSRSDPVCAVFGSCGGCAWQHVAYPAQLDAKRAILRAALERIGGLVLPEEIPLEPSPSPYAYRGRTRVAVEAGQVGYRRRRSHRLCPTSRCPILLPALERELAQLAARPPTRDGEWELAIGEAPPARATPLPAPGGEERAVVLRVGEDRLRVSPGVFAQSNALLTEKLARAVVAAAGEGARALELFAGAGLFTLGLARRFVRVVAVEAAADAARDLEANLAAAGLRHVEQVAAPVEWALARPPVAGFEPEVIVLDPPRTGLPRGVPDALADAAPQRIVYLSCDPATLARDLTVLLQRRYRCVGVAGFDLFPQTPHVEALVTLERAPQPRHDADGRRAAAQLSGRGTS